MHSTFHVYIARWISIRWKVAKKQVCTWQVTGKQGKDLRSLGVDPTATSQLSTMGTTVELSVVKALWDFCLVHGLGRQSVGFNSTGTDREVVADTGWNGDVLANYPVKMFLHLLTWYSISNVRISNYNIAWNSMFKNVTVYVSKYLLIYTVTSGVKGNPDDKIPNHTVFIWHVQFCEQQLNCVINIYF